MTYGLMFSICDQFNKDLYNYTWPYKTGGGIKYSTTKAIYNFYFSSNFFVIELNKNRLKSKY